MRSKMRPELTLEVKVDRKAFAVGLLNSETDDKRHWHSMSPEERLAALELARQVIYGYAGTTPRLQRIFEVARLVAG